MALGISHVGPPMMRHVWGKPSQQSLALTASHTHEPRMAWYFSHEVTRHVQICYPIRLFPIGRLHVCQAASQPPPFWSSLINNYCLLAQQYLS